MVSQTARLRTGRRRHRVDPGGPQQPSRMIRVIVSAAASKSFRVSPPLPQNVRCQVPEVRIDWVADHSMMKKCAGPPAPSVPAGSISPPRARAAWSRRGCAGAGALRNCARAGSRWRRSGDSAAWRRELQLRANVGGDGLSRLALRHDVVEGTVPTLDEPLDHGRVEALLGREVVVNVRLRQAADPRDLLHVGAVKTLVGEERRRRAGSAPRSARMRGSGVFVAVPARIDFVMLVPHVARRAPRVRRRCSQSSPDPPGNMRKNLTHVSGSPP